MTRIHQDKEQEDIPLVESGLLGLSDQHDTITAVGTASPLRHRRRESEALKKKRGKLARPLPGWKAGVYAVLFGSKMNVLMVFVPFAFLAHANHWSDSLTFLFSLLSICPFAERLG